MFNRSKSFIELHLTHNNSFQHHCTKIIENHGKSHCALCYHRQTQYGCSLCEVLLCRTPTTKVTQKGVLHRDSYFNLWHTKREIEVERKKIMTMEKSKATGTGSKATVSTTEKSKATGAGSRSKSTPKSSTKKQGLQIAYKKGLLEVVKELHKPVFQKPHHHRRNQLWWQLGWVRKRQLL